MKFQVLMLVCLWLYAARRFYTVWSTVLNFSIAASDRDNGQQKGETTLIMVKAGYSSSM